MCKWRINSSILQKVIASDWRRGSILLFSLMLTSPVLKSFDRFYLFDRCLRLWQISLYLSLQVFHCIPTDKVRSLSDLNTYKVRGGKGFLAQNYRSDFTKAFLRDEGVCLSWDPLHHMWPREEVPEKYPAHNNTASRWLRRRHLHHISNLFPWRLLCVTCVNWCLVLTKMFRAETKSYLVFSLSNDRDEKGSDFFCYGAIGRPRL